MNSTREWWPIQDRSVGSRNNSTKPLRIFNWNILAPYYVDPCLYKDVHPSLLHWEKRVVKIIECILFYEPDIITLQEMPQSSYFSFFTTTLGKHGYEGHFVPKSFLKTSSGLDGVATFWRSARFSILEKESVSFNVNQLMDRPQVACLVFLQDQLQLNKRLLVANTHLLFNVNRGEIKLGQLQLLMLAMWAMLGRWSHLQIVSSDILKLCSEANLKHEWDHFSDQQYENHQPNLIIQNMPGILMCGDFNLTPNSILYQWIRHGQCEFTDQISPTSFSGQKSLVNNTYRIDRQAREMRGTAPSFFPSCLIPKKQSDISLTSKGHHKRVMDQRVGWNKKRGLSENESSVTASSPLVYVLRLVDSIHVRDLFYRRVVKWMPAEPLKQAMMHLKPDTISYEQCQKILTHKFEALHQHAATSPSWILYHPFRLKSSYARPCGDAANSNPEKNVEKEPAYTAFHGWQKGCIDYIWYSSNELKVDGLLEFPRMDVLESIQNLPHHNFPGSDHFYLVVDLVWTEEKNRAVAIIQ